MGKAGEQARSPLANRNRLAKLDRRDTVEPEGDIHA